ncbi:MAG: hypothetical protein HY428_00775 [Candidatus Levybacteria bacterium]|nr:hypothetical protein [Candidatus Levybacteria bacterium]
MFVSKRVIKKRKNRKKAIVIGLVVLTALFATCVAAYFWLVSQRPLYISPLAFSGGSVRDVLFDTDSSEDAVKRSLARHAVAYERIQSSSDSAILVTLKSGEEVVMSKTRNLDEQISSLQLILSRLTMEGKRISQLDLRYDKPVVKFRQI